MKLRNHAFDLLCGLCIIRMIMLHCISLCGYRDSLWFSKLMAWTFFFLCFFFFKAGYFNKGVHTPFPTYLWDRIKRLLVPYLSWGAIGSVVFFGLIALFPEELEGVSKKLKVEHVWLQSHFYGNPPVWFLFSFFWMYVLVGIRSLIPRVKGITSVLEWGVFLACPFVSYWLWTQKNPIYMSLNNLSMGLFFFYLGHLWKQLQDRIPRNYFVALSVLLTVGFAVGNHFWHGEYDMSLNKWVQNPWGAVVNISCALCGLSGLLLSIPLPRIPIVGYIGEHSMVYFVMHYPIIHYIKLIRQIGKHPIYHHWNDFILMVIIILLMCSWMVPYIERIPLLSGRWKKKVVAVGTDTNDRPTTADPS